jgi:hypothetical protein
MHLPVPGGQAPGHTSFRLCVGGSAPAGCASPPSASLSPDKPGTARRIRAKKTPTCREKMSRTAEIGANATARTWQSIPPVLGSTYAGTPPGSGKANDARQGDSFDKTADRHMSRLMVSSVSLSKSNSHRLDLVRLSSILLPLGPNYSMLCGESQEDMTPCGTAQVSGWQASVAPGSRM